MNAHRTFLVTGAAGFIGSHVTEALLRAGNRVVGVDNFDPYYDRATKEQNLTECRSASPDRFAFAQADITDPDAIRPLFALHRPQTVVHLAGRAGVRPSIEDPAGYARANVLGTAVMLEEARRAAAARFVLASSSSVYGNCNVPPGTPFSEDLDVSEPISPYAATKRACELLAFTHSRLTRMPVACLRFFTVFGPRQRPDLAIGKFLALAARNQPIPMFGDGATSRDYTYIDDIVSGVLAACERIDAFGFRIWNLGGNSPVSLSEMIAAAGRVTGRRPVVTRLPMQPGDVERTFADLTRARAELGFSPTTGLEEGMRRQLNWMRHRAMLD